MDDMDKKIDSEPSRLHRLTSVSTIVSVSLLAIATACGGGGGEGEADPAYRIGGVVGVGDNRTEVDGYVKLECDTENERVVVNAISHMVLKSSTGPLEGRDHITTFNDDPEEGVRSQNCQDAIEEVKQEPSTIADSIKVDVVHQGAVGPEDPAEFMDVVNEANCEKPDGLEGFVDKVALAPC